MTDSVERRIKDMSDMTRIFEQRGFEKGFKEGFEEGLEESRKKVIEALAETMCELGYSKESIVKQVEKKFSQARDEAENAVERYLEE